jgi:hypothetical protein
MLGIPEEEWMALLNVPLRAVFDPVLLALVCAIEIGCGPSLQVRQEGERFFERCYALDETPEVRNIERASCWKLWIERYAEIETRDRAFYAQRQYRKLAK